MAPRALLSGLALVFLALSASAGNDPAGQIDNGIARQRAMAQKPADADLLAGAGAAYGSEREAAVAFVALVRKYPDQRMEYCTYLLRGADGRFRFSPIRQGDMNHCPADRPKPKDAVASVHTHPQGGRDSDPSSAGQVFSEGDFAFSESAEMNFPIYLGAPAGHVLRYVPGGTLCKGESFVIRNFEIVRDARSSVRGLLPINPGEKTPLYSQSGVKLPKPPYCRPAP